MREAGMGAEQVARALHAERRLLGEQFKALTPPGKLAEIYERNLARYGDKLGPSIDWLGAQGKSWDGEPLNIESETYIGLTITAMKTWSIVWQLLCKGRCASCDVERVVY